MPTVSELIAEFLRRAVTEAGGEAMLSRNDLAERFSCVPSQINYVLTTRFTPESGFIVESRRGGGGYIRITRVRPDPSALLMHTVNGIGAELDAGSARAVLNNLLSCGAIAPHAAQLMSAATSDTALRAAPVEKRDALRAAILKQCLLQCV